MYKSDFSLSIFKIPVNHHSVVLLVVLSMVWLIGNAYAAI
jgi:hypothetical protein